MDLVRFKVDVTGAREGEAKWVEETAIKLYNAMASIMNAGVCDYFNRDPNWIGKSCEEGSEYMNAYGELMMEIAGACSKQFGVRNGRIVKLCGGIDCLLLYPTEEKIGNEDVYQGIIKCKVEDHKT